MRTAGLLMTFLVLLPWVAVADTHYVAINNPTPQVPYTNWSTAANDIQSAISASVDGDTVLVSNGVYDTGRVLVSGVGDTNRVAVTNQVRVVSVNGCEDAIIDGSSRYRCVYLGYGAELEGFTLRYGACVESGGAGVHCDSRATLSSCVVMECSEMSSNRGGGVYAPSGDLSVRIRDCSIVDNWAYEGGGVAGGAVEHCVIRGNQALYGGGVSAAGLVVNSLVIKNSALLSGGGIKDCSQVLNCTVAANTANERGGVTGCADVENTILSANEPDNAADNDLHSYCCSTPALEGFGNITNDPQFVDSANDDYRLQTGSPCIDAGIDPGGISDDLDGIPRPLDGNNSISAAYDIGAYEFIHALADSDGDALADTNELAIGTSPVLFDSDGDSIGDNAEVLAGTDPTDNASALRLLTDQLTSSDEGNVIRWPSAAGRTYDVVRITNLVEDIGTVIFSSVAADPPINTVTDTTASAINPCYYRVRLTP